MKLLIVGILLAGGTVMAKAPKITDDNMKSCLAEVYTKQTIFHNEHSKYAKNAKELSVQKNEICKGIKLKFRKANKEVFVVIGKAGKNTWSIDDTKTLQKIK